jgi:hypothetical protein
MFPLLVSLVTFAAPGEIFGDIRQGETYLAEVPVVLTCGAEKVDGKTDKQGSFRLKTTGAGKCTLSVTVNKQSPSVEEVGGKLVLKRV